MIKLIPAIDIIDGKCVRLSQGDYNKQITYCNDPLTIAKEFEQIGFTHLHLVDLEGAKAKHIVNIKVLDQLAQNTNLKIDFGGGIKSNMDIEMAFNAGAHQITAGSIAISEPDVVFKWIEKYSCEKIILGTDVLNNKIAINGWLNQTEVNIQDLLLTYISKGIEYCICTDVSKDGMLQGVNMDLYMKVKESFPNLNIIASGGVSSISDIEQLNAKEIYGAIIGKAFYEKKITISEFQKYL